MVNMIGSVDSFYVNSLIIVVIFIFLCYIKLPYTDELMYL